MSRKTAATGESRSGACWSIQDTGLYVDKDDNAGSLGRRGERLRERGWEGMKMELRASGRDAAQRSAAHVQRMVANLYQKND